MAFLPILILTLASIGGTTPSPELVVGGHRWGRVVSKTVITERGTYTLDPDVRLPQRRPGTAPWTIVLQREAYVLLRNTGPKTVKAVRWTYVFYSDPKHEHEVGRFNFTTKTNLKPGEMKYLSEHVENDAPTAYDEVVIQGVDLEGDAKK